MFVRWNDTLKYYEYDTSAGQTGAGPWLQLPNIVYEDQSNNFTSPVQVIKANNPMILFSQELASPGFRATRLEGFSDFYVSHVSDANDAYVVRFRFDRSGNFHCLNGKIFEFGRSVASGHWQTYSPIYVAGSGIVASGGTLSGQYTLIGKTIIIQFQISGFTTAVGAGEFWITLPPGIQIASFLSQTANVVNWTADGANWKQVMVYSTATDTTMRFYNVAWAGGSGNHIWGTITLPIA